MEGREQLARGYDRGVRVRESVGAHAAGDVRGLGEKGSTRISLESGLQSSHPVENVQHGAFRLQSSRAGPSPILHLLAAFRARAAFPRPHFLFSAKRRGREGAGDKGRMRNRYIPA